MDGVKADMVMTDPPYGINAEKMTMGTGAKDFYRGEGWDSERPDISIALTLADNVCIWGGNYFADILPISNDWLVWHKKNDGLSFSECELAWTNFGCNTRHFSHHWGGEKKLHVTMKPLEVIAWAMNKSKEKAKTVVDLFGGSGSTLIACEQTGRKCYMMELDPHYADVIIDRWEKMTGEKAVLVSSYTTGRGQLQSSVTIEK
jgi:DNA modification methylase